MQKSLRILGGYSLHLPFQPRLDPWWTLPELGSPLSESRHPRPGSIVRHRGRMPLQQLLPLARLPRPLPFPQAPPPDPPRPSRLQQQQSQQQQYRRRGKEPLQHPHPHLVCRRGGALNRIRRMRLKAVRRCTSHRNRHQHHRRRRHPGLLLQLRLNLQGTEGGMRGCARRRSSSSSRPRRIASQGPKRDLLRT